MRLGAYCSECGQPAHIHRSFASVGHDLLHSVFHFEGKFWRTMPELAFRPGRLTRRYIDGERAKFISPMALFLFTVFLMYAVYAFLPDEAPAEVQVAPVPEEAPAEVRVTPPAAEVQQQRGPAAGERPGTSDPGQQLAGTPVDRPATPTSDIDQPPAPISDVAEPPATARDGLFNRAVEKLREDPALTLYKLKTNGYKFSWLLVPLSIPFMWLLFFWRREFRLYDHAVFVTYSISFMTLLLITSMLVNAAGAAAVGTALTVVVPPVHIYRQLRGAYGLSRRGALVRLFFVLAAAGIVISIFGSTLFLMGAL